MIFLNSVTSVELLVLSETEKDTPPSVRFVFSPVCVEIMVREAEFLMVRKRKSSFFFSMISRSFATPSVLLILMDAHPQCGNVPRQILFSFHFKNFIEIKTIMM